MLFKSRLAQHFVHFREGVGAVLVVLALHGQRLGLELRLGVLEALEPVGLGLHNRFEVFFGEGRVIDRAVVRGVGVRLGSGALEQLFALLGRVVVAPAKHDVLEEVREAALAGLDLVARARRDDDVERDEVRVVGRNRHETQAVGQVVNRVLVREKLTAAALLRKAHDRQCRQQEGGENQHFHIVKFSTNWIRNLLGDCRDYTSTQGKRPR